MKTDRMTGRTNRQNNTEIDRMTDTQMDKQTGRQIALTT